MLHTPSTSEKACDGFSTRLRGRDPSARVDDVVDGADADAAAAPDDDDDDDDGEVVLELVELVEVAPEVQGLDGASTTASGTM